MGPQVRDHVRPLTRVGCAIVGEADTVGDPVQALVELGGDFFARPHHRNALEDLVADQICHRVPIAALGHLVEFDVHIPPTVGFQGGEIGGRGTVEGQLLARRVLDAGELFFLVGGDDQGGADDLEVSEPPAALAEPFFQGGKRIGEQRMSAVEGVGDETIGDLARHLGHQRPEAAGEDGGRPKGIGPGVECGDHQGVAVKLAAKIEFGLALPAIEDRLDGQDDLAHARGGLRPRHAEAVQDMRPDLGAQSEKEAAASNVLGPVREVREVHGIARERDGDGRSQPEVLRVLRGHRQREKGVVLGFETESAVVADFLKVGIEGAGVPGILQWGRCVDLHDIFRCAE